jgi:hypothetical protein
MGHGRRSRAVRLWALCALAVLPRVTSAQVPFAVSEPLSGDTWAAGAQHFIRWTPGGGNVRIEVSRDGAPFEVIFGNVPNDGEQAWVVTGPSSAAARIRVTQLSAPNASAMTGSFTIVNSPAQITVVSPAAGDAWTIGTVQDIAWTQVGDPVGNVRIELSRDGGGVFETLFGNTPNDGHETWVVSGPPGAQMVVRVTPLDDPTGMGLSEAFTIRGIAVMAPNGSEVWVVGSQQLIAWDDGESSLVMIELSRDGGSTWETLFESTPNDGAQLWFVTEPFAGDCLVRVTQLDASGASDTSDSSFSITGTVGFTVTAPSGGEVWPIGSRQSIKWEGLVGGRVAIEFSRDGGDTWELRYPNVVNDGDFSFIVEGPPSEEVLVRVSRLTSPLVSDVSDAPATITLDPLIVQKPVPGESLIIGTERAIQWASLGSGEVRIELSRDGGGTWETLFDRTPNDGSQFWNVSGPASTAAVIRITGLDGSVGFDATDGTFAIAHGVLSLVRPNGGEQWGTQTSQLIEWRSSTLGTVRVELSRDGGATWETLFLNTPNDGNEPYTVRGPLSNHCRVRITSWQDPVVGDTSDGPFVVFCQPLTRPILAGQTIDATLGPDDCVVPQRPGAKSQLFTFSMPATALVTVDVASAAFDPHVVLYGPEGTIIAENDNAGASTAARLDSIELPAGGPYTIVASAVGGGAGPYRVTLSRFDVEVLAPAGGETWKFGERRTLTWKSGAPIVPATVTLFREGLGRPGETLFAATTNDGTEGWDVTPPATGQAVLQVCIPNGSRGGTVCDTSRPFTLEPCTGDETRPCYGGPPRTLGVGICAAGTQTCRPDGVFAACQGAVLPAAEVCGDGVDSDCNGNETFCAPCPAEGACDDADPCTADACTAGECRSESPPMSELLDCRRETLRSALASAGGVCTGSELPKSRRRRLERLVTKLERALARARRAPTVAKCVRQLERARQKSTRLDALVATVCPAAQTMLAPRVSAMSMAIVAASSCEPRP